MGSLGWFVPNTETQCVLVNDFHHFFPRNHSLEKQLEWIDSKIRESSTFLQAVITETGLLSFRHIIDSTV